MSEAITSSQVSVSFYTFSFLLFCSHGNLVESKIMLSKALTSYNTCLEDHRYVFCSRHDPQTISLESKVLIQANKSLKR